MDVGLIVGLGNPGAEYEDTRHNAGFWFVDELADQCGEVFRHEKRFLGDVAKIRLGRQECWLLKPQTFMNRSGQSVSLLANYFKIEPEEILVVHDELDLSPGAVKLKRGGGHAGHNGLRDIIKAVSTPKFLRLRLGIGHPGSKNQVVDYVLGRPGRDDRVAIDATIDRTVRLLPEMLSGTVQQAMKLLHSEYG